MTVNGYTSRSIPNPKDYADMLERRMAAKKAGDKTTANALKLVANTTYGAMLNQYNDLYDPLMGRSVCISGQLYLLELSIHLYRDIDDLRVIQLNTDGIMIEFDDSQYEQVQEILREWQERTGFELEEDSIRMLVQKDVNGYIEVQYSNDVKIKGGVLVRGIAPAGAFKVNNNATIVSKAVVEYFTENKPVAKTIRECNDIMAFQLIAKASSKYNGAYQIIDGKFVDVQRCNRVYAVTDERYGTLYKKRKDGGSIKVAGLPEHCMIDNANELTIDVIDKDWYIALAEKYVNDFLGTAKESKTKKEDKMATKSTTPKTEAKKPNIYQKLVGIRREFANSEVGKSGLNIHAEFEYFELSDILPVATVILTNFNTLFITTFPEGKAVGTLINLDNLDEKIEFSFDTVHIKDPAKFRMNEAQACGAEQTYYRRYLYFQLLDIAPNDVFDGKAKTPAPVPAAPEKPKKPATTEERAEVKKNLTNTDGKADELQIEALKGALKELLEADPSQEEAIQTKALKTKGFTEITRSQCEELILGIQEQLKTYNINAEEEQMWNGKTTAQ